MINARAGLGQWRGGYSGVPPDKFVGRALPAFSLTDVESQEAGSARPTAS
ncbi:MAG: hypothetical protein ACE5F9_05820 [Phycisphaerae bacterium]